MTAAEPAQAISCLGKLMPDGGVCLIAAPYALQGPSILSEMKVKEGDWVRKGDVLATTHYRFTLAAALRQAEAKELVARKRLRVVEAGQKAGEIAAQKAETRRMEVELGFQQADYARQEQLFKSGTLSQSALDRALANLDSQKRLFEWNQERLNSISEIRDVDIAVAKAEVEQAEADVLHARADLEDASIRAPRDGQILKLLARPGESCAARAILELGDTKSMVVIAEVYETDAPRLSLGQKAEVTGGGITEKCLGKVEQIGLRVERNELAPIEPASYTNLRVVEVKIRLDAQPKSPPLVFSQVAVRITP